MSTNETTIQDVPQSPPQATEPHGMSLDDAITEVVEIDALYAELKERKKRALDVILPEAYDTRGAQNTVHLANHAGNKLKVEFKLVQKCDVNLLNTARELLGDDKFEGLFKTEYSPRLRDLKMFMSTKTTDERIETAKGIISEGWKQVEMSPYVSVEKK